MSAAGRTRRSAPGARRVPAANVGTALESGAFPRAAFVAGSEPVLRDRATTVLVERALPEEARDFDLVRYSGEGLEVDAVVAACATLPMLGERRVVLVRHFNLLHHARRRALLGRLPAVLSESTLLVVESESLTPAEAGLIGKLPGAWIVDADRPDERRILAAMAEEARRHGLTMEPAAAERLLAARGQDLTGIVAEIEKLARFLGDRKRVTAADVAELVPAARATTIFDLIDQIVAGNGTAALAIAEDQFARGEDPVGVVAMAYRHFSILLRAKGLHGRDRSRGAAARKLSVPPFFVDRYLAQADRVSAERLRAIMGELLDADLALKTHAGSREARQSRGRLLILRLAAAMRPSRGRGTVRRATGGRLRPSR